VAEYVVLFRLPLNPGSRVDNALRADGWQSLNEVVYYRALNLNRDEVVEHIKRICAESRGMPGAQRMGAFTVVPVDEHLRNRPVNFRRQAQNAQLN
jgi:hypothetical protein